jgi:hypothetical protein
MARPTSAMRNARLGVTRLDFLAEATSIGTPQELPTFHRLAKNSRFPERDGQKLSLPTSGRRLFEPFLAGLINNIH